MSVAVDIRWCPTCAVESMAGTDGACMWCGTAMTGGDRRLPGPRPKGKRPRVYKRRRDAKLSAAQVQAAWVMYDRGRLSVRAISRQIWERWGFATAKSCAVALYDAFQLEGHQLRDRIEATKLASTTHGLRPRSGTLPGYKEVRARRARETGRVRGVYCNGVRTNHPRKGEPCKLAALAGSEYCFGHDPARAGQRNAILAAARERIAA